MIKKMLAMLAVVSCAFGAWADATHISGTDFAPLSVGEFLTGLDDSGNATESTYWFTGNTDDFDGNIITNALNEKILDFESNITNPVYRTILGCYGATAPSGFTPTNINTVLFVDTFVAFTPYLVNENHPAPTKLTNEDKILVWVRETEVENDANITNLIVTAGYLDVYGAPTPTNYVVNLTGSGQTVSGLCNGLHRLTIKAFKSITTVNDSTAGFVIYVDEYPVECVGDVFADGCAFAGNNLAATPKKYSDLDQLFPSMMPYNASTPANQLSAIGYAGVGQIGEVWYDDYSTDYPAFAGDNEQDFTVTFGDDVASFIYKDVTYTSPTNLTAGSSETSVIISNVVYASGWKHADGMWRNGETVVSNQVGTVGDYGTFNFADGSAFILAGFQSNYMVFDGVKTNEYQTLYGPGGALAAALLSGNLILNSNIVISEGTGDQEGCLLIEEGLLTIDLNGHTIQGTGLATIVNMAGTLTINDSSVGQTGKVLDSTLTSLAIYLTAGATELNAGTYEHIELYADPTFEGDLVINGGTYLQDAHTPDADDFYLKAYAQGKEITWSLTSPWYATVGGSAPVTTYEVTFSTNTVVVAEYTTNIAAGATLPVDAIPAFTGGAWDLDPTNAVINAATNFNYTVAAPVITWDITFSTNNVIVTEWNLTVDDGDPIGNHIPNFTGGSWDVTPTAETVVNSDTNFNYTIETSYTLTYVSDHGAVPDGVVYTASTPDFALAAAPDPGVVGVAFAGWVIGSVTNEAGATFVVADHLENTTATAAWVAVVPPAYFPQTDIDPSSPYAGRDGTPAKPFVIRNLADLEAFKTYVEDGTFASSSFEVVSNITATGWVGVGTEANKFEGTLNGNGKTIDLALAAGKYNGLFRYVNNATISNLTVNVTGVTVSGSTGGAAFVGYAYGSCTFETLKATGTYGSAETPTSHNAAGIVCNVNGTGTFNFNYCTNAMAIYANYTKVGGIVAFRTSGAANQCQLNFNYCVSSGDISNVSTDVAECSGTGGLLGWTGQSIGNQYTVINGCECTGSITVAGRAGGFIGYAHVHPSVSGVSKALASLPPAGSGTLYGTSYWATVSGDIATFVDPAATVTDVVAYKVMQANSSPNFTLADPDASLTIDSSLAAYSGTVSVDSTLSADYDLRETAILNGTIYSLVSKAPAGTVIYLTMGSGVDSLSTSSNGTDWVAYTEALQDVELGSTLYIKGTSSVTGYEVPQFSIVVDDTHATEQTALVVNKSAIVYFPQTSIEQEWADRNGTAAKPFVIRTADDFVALKNGVANGTVTNQHFEVVGNNITLTDWVGIGTSSSVAFAGTLNGGGKTVNVTFAAGAKYNGLFAFVNNATLSNLTVNVTAGAVSGSTGGAAFVGKAYGSCTFAALKATGSLGSSSVPVTHNAASMVVSLNGSGGTFDFNNCTNEMAIYANYTKVGGLVAFREGSNNSQINFNNCVNSASLSNISADAAECSGTGGLMGWTGYANPSKILVNGCSSIGSVTAVNGTASSIVGYRSSSPVMSGVNTVLASLKPSGTSTIDGCNWATVDGDLATFVTPVANVGETVTYKLMQSGGAAQGFTLTADDASLTIITNFYDYTGTVSVDASLTAQGYELVETPDVNGVTFTCAIPTPTDPWAPAEETDAAASNKVEEIFGEAVAGKVNTFDAYTNMVAYIKSVTSETEVPDDLSSAQKTHIYQSWMLGAATLFTEDPVISITSVAASSEAGKWDFTVVVTTETASPTALQVAADKVKALVKVRNSLTTGSWAAPAAADVSAAQLLGGYAIKVTVNYGEAGSGFMKISD